MVVYNDTHASQMKQRIPEVTNLLGMATATLHQHAVKHAELEGTTKSLATPQLERPPTCACDEREDDDWNLELKTYMGTKRQTHHHEIAGDGEQRDATKLGPAFSACTVGGAGPPLHTGHGC